LRVFVPFAVGYFFSYLLRNANAVIAPELTRDLGIAAADLGLLTSAYLLAFGAFQLPLGILLDRYGARRVEAALVLVAAAGCALFSRGTTLAELTLARAMIGFGVSACLMASFKAFTPWFGSGRQASLNAAIMAAGGLGALSASTPLSWALPLFGWRGIFLAIASLGLVVALLIFTSAEKRASAAGETLGEQLRGLASVLSSPVYWRFAPLSATVTGGFMAVQGLWAVPWLMHFNGYSRDVAAFHLLLTGIAMVSGFVGIATQVGWLQRRGIAAQTLLLTGLGSGLLVILLIVLDAAPTTLLWFAMGLVFSVSNLAYALLAGHFPAHLSGRANTALNLAAFVGAFSIQWGFGGLVDLLQAHGLALREAYRWSFIALLGLQAISTLWFRFARTRLAQPART
jgi:MFS family permease